MKLSSRRYAGLLTTYLRPLHENILMGAGVDGLQPTVVVLREGRVEARGNLAELLEVSDEMRRLWQADGVLDGDP